MFRAFQSELVKLKRPWMLAGVMGPLIGFSIISTVIQFLLSDRAGTPRGVGLKSPAELAAADGLARVLTDSAVFAGVIVVVVFATGFATEFGWGTLRNLLVRQPNRAKLLVGKFLGILDFVFLGIFLGAIGCLLTALVMGKAQNIATSAWFTSDGISAFVSATVNLMLSAAGWASLGLLAAVVFRSPGPAVGIVLALFPIEALVSTWWDKGNKWLPGQLFSNVANGGRLLGTTGELTSTFHRALSLSLGYSLVAMSIALFLFIRNDVTS